MKYFKLSLSFIALLAIGFMMAFTGCEKVDEMPKINEGYETNYRMPDPSYLNDEDRQFLNDQEEEYEKNTP